MTQGLPPVIPEFDIEESTKKCEADPKWCRSKEVAKLLTEFGFGKSILSSSDVIDIHAFFCFLQTVDQATLVMVRCALPHIDVLATPLDLTKLLSHFKQKKERSQARNGEEAGEACFLQYLESFKLNVAQNMIHDAQVWSPQSMRKTDLTDEQRLRICQMFAQMELNKGCGLDQEEVSMFCQRVRYLEVFAGEVRVDVGGKLHVSDMLDYCQRVKRNLHPNMDFDGILHHWRCHIKAALFEIETERKSINALQLQDPNQKLIGNRPQPLKTKNRGGRKIPNTREIGRPIGEIATQSKVNNAGEELGLCYFCNLM